MSKVISQEEKDWIAEESASEEMAEAWSHFASHELAMSGKAERMNTLKDALFGYALKGGVITGLSPFLAAGINNALVLHDRIIDQSSGVLVHAAQMQSAIGDAGIAMTFGAGAIAVAGMAPEIVGSIKETVKKTLSWAGRNFDNPQKTVVMTDPAHSSVAVAETKNPSLDAV